MNLESDKRLIQLRLDFSSAPTGEARQTRREDIESLSVVSEPERPTNTLCLERVSATSRTAVYGPVRMVVWEGRSREAPPYSDRWEQSGKHLLTARISHIDPTATFGKSCDFCRVQERFSVAELFLLSPRGYCPYSTPELNPAVCPNFDLAASWIISAQARRNDTNELPAGDR
jgi:hypothetical protein